MLTGEFERDAEQNSNDPDKILSDSADLPVTDGAVHVDHTGALMPTQPESMISITQFIEKFLEQNLSKYNFQKEKRPTF